MPWPQNCDPLHSWLLSALVLALPVIALSFALLALKLRAWGAALVGLIMALGLVLLVFQMPLALVNTTTALGMLFGLLRIAWIVIASISLFRVALETEQFQVMKESIATLSNDQRLQLVLIAFCFGAFLKGDRRRWSPCSNSRFFSHWTGLRALSCCNALPGR